MRDVAAEAPPVPAEVIDRAVLAEHRAKRAEQGLEDLAERMRALEAHLAEVTAERDRLREDLEDAEAAEERRNAGLHEQLARLRESAAQTEGLQAALRTARGDADAAAGDLHEARDELTSVRAELETVREERDGLREAVARVGRVGTEELGEIARALRDQADERRAEDASAAADEGEDPFDLALAQLRARSLPAAGEEGGNVIPFDPLRNTMNLAAMSPGRRARSRLRRVAPEDRKVLQGDSLGPERRSGVAWLAGAIDLLAAEDIRAAGAFLVSLLPDGARTLGESLVYDIHLDGVGAYRVTLRGSTGEVAPKDEDAPGEPAFRLSGPVAALATLGAGGAPRRLGGAVRVHGSRRALRRLLKSRRVPVDLGDLAAAGVVPEPGAAPPGARGGRAADVDRRERLRRRRRRARAGADHHRRRAGQAPAGRRRAALGRGRAGGAHHVARRAARAARAGRPAGRRRRVAVGRGGRHDDVAGAAGPGAGPAVTALAWALVAGRMSSTSTTHLVTVRRDELVRCSH